MKRTTKSIAGGWLRLSLVVAGLEFHGPGIRVYEERCSAHHQKFMLVPFCTLSHTPPSQPPPKMSSSDCSHHHRQSLWSLNLFFRPSLSPLSACSPSLTNILTGILSNTSAFSLKSFYVFLFFTSFSSRLQSTAFFVFLSIHPFCFPLFSGGMFSSVLR